MESPQKKNNKNVKLWVPKEKNNKKMKPGGSQTKNTKNMDPGVTEKEKQQESGASCPLKRITNQKMEHAGLPNEKQV